MNKDEYVEQMKQYRQAFRTVLATTDGKRVMEYLEDTFQKTVLFDSDTHKMAYKTAQYELIEFIRDMGANNADK